MAFVQSTFNNDATGSARRNIIDRCFILLCVVYAIVFITLSLSRHATFNTGLDLAIFDQIVSNSMGGNLFKSTIIDVMPGLNGYFMPLIIGVVPFYALLSDARALLIVQTLGMTAAVFPIYWYARSQVKPLLALATALVYFLSPAVEFVNLDQFHVISLATPLLSFAVYFLLRRRYTPFLVCTILAWSVKEEISLVVIGIGAFLFLVQRKYFLGLLVATFGVVSAAVLPFFVIPVLTGKPYFVGHALYASFGENFADIALGMATSPDKVWSIVSSPEKIEFVVDLFFPLALLPIAGIEVNLVSLPLLVGLLLTNPSFAWIRAHYPAAILPALYFATVVGLRRLLFFRSGRNRDESTNNAEMGARKTALAMLLLIASLLSYVDLAPGPFGGDFKPSLYLVDADAKAGLGLVTQVQREAMVVAQEELAPHFSNRTNFYVFPSIPDYRQTDYLIAEKGRFFYDFHKGSLENWFSTGYFEIVSDANNFILARRREPKNLLHTKYGNDFTLVGYTIWPEGVLRGGMTLRPIVSWQASNAISERYAVTVQVVDAQGHVWAAEDREPDGGFSPTNQWKVSKSVGDQYTLRLPPTMPTGDYEITVGLHKVGDDNYLDAYDKDGNWVGNEVAFAKVHVEKNKLSFTASQLVKEQPLSELFVDMRELRFLGYVPPRQTISPGELLQVGLYWRAREKPRGDYIVAVQLRDADGRVAFEQAARPAAGTYPTTQWDPGEVLLDWHDFLLPNYIREGDYQIVVILRDADGSRVQEVGISDISIRR